MSINQIPAGQGTVEEHVTALAKANNHVVAVHGSAAAVVDAQKALIQQFGTLVEARHYQNGGNTQMIFGLAARSVTAPAAQLRTALQGAKIEGRAMPTPHRAGGYPASVQQCWFAIQL